MARWRWTWNGLDVLRWKLQGCLNVTVVGYEGAGERVRATSAGIVVESTIRRLRPTEPYSRDRVSW